jgi:hypothetical protein
MLSPGIPPPHDVFSIFKDAVFPDAPFHVSNLDPEHPFNGAAVDQCRLTIGSICEPEALHGVALPKIKRFQENTRGNSGAIIGGRKRKSNLDTLRLKGRGKGMACAVMGHILEPPRPIPYPLAHRAKRYADHDISQGGARHIVSHPDTLGWDMWRKSL